MKDNFGNEIKVGTKFRYRRNSEICTVTKCNKGYPGKYDFEFDDPNYEEGSEDFYNACDINFFNNSHNNVKFIDQTPDLSNDPEANELIDRLNTPSEAQKRQYKSLVEQMDDILSEAEEKRFEAYLVKHFKKSPEFVETKEHLQYGIVFDLLTDIQNSNNTDNEEFDRIQKAIDILVDL